MSRYVDDLDNLTPGWGVPMQADAIRRFLAPLIRHVRTMTEADAAAPCEKFAAERRRATARLDAIRQQLHEAIDSNETDDLDEGADDA